VAKFVNSYPSIEVSYAIADSDSLTSSDPVVVTVTLDREADESNPDDQVADAALFPHKKMVSWWIVVGDAATKTLYGIKKVTVKERVESKLELNLPQGQYQLKLYLICDSYAGADQDFDLERISVVEGEESEEEDSDEEMDE
jgi:pre-mRNA-splicing helicase BRR2